MKGTSALTIAVCVACFLIGYLAYLGTAYILDFVTHRIGPCQESVELCNQERMSPNLR